MSSRHSHMVSSRSISVRCTSQLAEMKSCMLMRDVLPGTFARKSSTAYSTAYNMAGILFGGHQCATLDKSWQFDLHRQPCPPFWSMAL